MTAYPHDPTQVQPSAECLDGVDGDVPSELIAVYQNEIEPILTRFFAGKLRSSMRTNDHRSANQDALELVSETKVRILKRLSGKSPYSENLIEDVQSYTRAVAQNVFNQYLRRKYPRRLSIKNQCRYLLAHHPNLEIRRDEKSDVWVCSFAFAREEIRGRRSNEVTARTIDEVRTEVRSKAPRGDTNELIETVLLLLERSGGSVALDDLVSAVIEVLNIKEPVEASNSDDHAILPARDPTTQAIVEESEFVRRLWDEIMRLPLRHRAALLLNFRDEKGDDLTSTITTHGAASIRNIAAALKIEAEEFALIWKDLPWDDNRIAAHLGVSRQQVINLRQSAKQKLRRTLAR